MDLFNPIVAPNKRHSNFTAVLNDALPHVRDVLSEWSQGFSDRDGKFVQEFQISFNSSFWELYLFACLKLLGCPPDLSFGRPDFVVRADDTTLCIEASTASHPQWGTPEWEASTSELKNLDRPEMIDLATVRLANTLASKHKKYLMDYSALAHVKDSPFVLAVSPFEQPFFFLQNQQAIMRVLYGYEGPVTIDDTTSDTRSFVSHRYIDSIAKENGAEVPLGYFRNDRMKGISAVLFSNTATLGKARVLSEDPRKILVAHVRYNDYGLESNFAVTPKSEYEESLLDGLCVFHNPFANNPLDQDLFDHPDITHWGIDPRIGLPVCESKDDALMHRLVIKDPAVGEGHPRVADGREESC